MHAIHFIGFSWEANVGTTIRGDCFARRSEEAEEGPPSRSIRHAWGGGNGCRAAASELRDGREMRRWLSAAANPSAACCLGAREIEGNGSALHLPLVRFVSFPENAPCPAGFVWFHYRFCPLINKYYSPQLLVLLNLGPWIGSMDGSYSFVPTVKDLLICVAFAVSIYLPIIPFMLDFVCVKYMLVWLSGQM